MADKIESVDDLQYDWPSNVVGYDSRFILGMNATDLIVVAGITIAGMMVHIVLGIPFAVVGFFLIKRFDGLGDRRVPQYAWLYLLHRLRHPAAVLPRVVPSGEDVFEILDNNGQVLMEVGGDE